MSEPLYKMMSKSEWEAFDKAESYAGSQADLRDGFVHLAAPDQLIGVCRRHFADKRDLVLVALDPAQFPVEVKWEAAHETYYPHLYAPLPRAAVLGADPIPDDPDQRQLMLALSCT